MKRDQLIAVYGEKVRALPLAAQIIEWRYPDGSGSWGWSDSSDELYDLVVKYARSGCMVWVDGEHVKGSGGDDE